MDYPLDLAPSRRVNTSNIGIRAGLARRSETGVEEEERGLEKNE
jgi:hypothetical protein